MADVTVRSGDTLSGLLKASGNPQWNNPQEWSKYTNTPDMIKPGQTFNFPSQMSTQSNMSQAPSQSMSTNNMSMGPNMSSVPVNQSRLSVAPGLNMSMIPKASPNMSSPTSPSVPDNSHGERTGEVPMNSGGRTPVVQGTPSWVVPILQKVSTKYNVPTSLLSAVAKHESGSTFDPTIRQPDGLGRGIFQLDIGQHPDVTEDEAFDPHFAADYAAKLLREGFDRTGSWEGALRYYNGGPAYNSNRPGYQGRPVNELTQNYARKVQAYTRDTIPVEDPVWKKKQEKDQRG